MFAYAGSCQVINTEAHKRGPEYLHLIHASPVLKENERKKDILPDPFATNRCADSSFTEATKREECRV
jgi:hypothetical protein